MVENAAADVRTLCARYGSQGEGKLAFTFHSIAIQREMACKDMDSGWIHLANSVNTAMFLRV
jgi:hypothetical protein